MPDFDANVVMVMSTYSGASAEDIETNVTKVLENTLNGVSNLKDISSTSRENISLITLEFKYGIDIDDAMNDVRDKLVLVSMALPGHASDPRRFQFSADDMPVLILSATADESLPGLDKILDDKVATPLARVSGVGSVTINGAPTREIKVYCDPNKLQAYGLSIATISQIIGLENRNIPSGNIDIGSSTYALRVEKEFNDPSELLDIVVGYSGHKAVYLRDVATVEDGEEERSQEAYTDGVRSATISITKQSGANAVNVIKGVKEKLVTIEDQLPSDIKLQTVVDSSDNIIQSVNSLKETILITLLVVAFVVFIFLGRWRATFIIVISIPIALLGSLVYLFATGNTLNIISMSALSNAIGMVVDDAIVVIENVSTHLERGEKPKEAAVHGTAEVGISVIASTLTMLCVFLPLTMMSGMAGIMFKQFGWIVAIIMIISTTAALTLVPMLCSKMLKAGPKTGKLHRMIFDPINNALDWVSRGYAKVIAWAVTHRKTVVFGTFGFAAVVLGIFGPALETEFFPKQDQGRLTVTIELPVGTSQYTTAEFAHRFYARMRDEVPELKISSMNYGQAASDNTMANMRSNGTHIISMNVNVGGLKWRRARCKELGIPFRSTGEISEVIRAALKEYPEVKKAMISEGMGGMGGASSVDVELYGYDFAESDSLARIIQAKLLESPNFVQVTLSRDEYTPEYQADFDRTQLALNGLKSSTADSAFSAAVNGTVGSVYREDGEEYSIRVRYAPEFRTSEEDIENIVVYSPMGGAVRMKDLGTIVETMVPPSIGRKNRERIITISGILADKVPLSRGVATAKDALSQVDIPNNMQAEIGGDFEDQQEMMKDMMTLMLLIIILVYMVMASQFESFMSPFVIMFSVPFALVGVVLGLGLTGTALGMMAMVGLIILLGIVVKNGIVLIDYTILLRERGYSVVDASVEAAKSRLRPILMTTLTTVLGMLPMALGTGEGAEMWRSLGMTVCWGLSISSLITLVLIPTVYCIFAVRQERNQARKLEERRAAELNA